jgi:hypothetical protein
MRAMLCLMAAISLAACSKADRPQVNQANADLKAAGAETLDAANKLTNAAAKDVKAAGAIAADKTGAALQSAGAAVKNATGNTASNNAASGN